MIGHLYTLLFIGSEPPPETTVQAQSLSVYDDDLTWWSVREELRIRENNNAAAINLILAIAASGALN